MRISKKEFIDKCLWFATTKLKDFITIIGNDSYMFKETEFEKYLNENIHEDDYEQGFSDATEKAWKIFEKYATFMHPRKKIDTCIMYKYQFLEAMKGE